MKLKNTQMNLYFFPVVGCTGFPRYSRYVQSFWTVNLEFADNKSIFDQKIVILTTFCHVSKQLRSLKVRK
jgi:hypothetical protein